MPGVITLAKRGLDIVASFLGLLVLSLPLTAVALWVYLDSGRPVLFRQTRIGRGGRPFSIIKFRTMVPGSESVGRLSVGDDPRITASGRVLRRYKLDELPQLLNVLMGDMSLVGPRPEVPEYAFVYPEQYRVWSVRPGITDPASIELYDEAGLLEGALDPERYYIETLLPKKTRLYLEYVESRSFCGDIQLILGTLARVVTESIGRQSRG